MTIISMHVLRLTLLDGQEGLTASSTTCDRGWNFNTVAFKYHQDVASVKIKDDIVQLGPYVSQAGTTTLTDRL